MGLVELTSVVKDYHALRPLRIEHLAVAERESVAITGLDAPAAETFVNLLTGITLPDAGRVVLFGRESASISGAEEWLSIADRFGIVSARAVMLEQLTVSQNLALPYSLDIEPLGEELRARAITAAREVGLEADDWDRPVAYLTAMSRLRVRVARALAFDPALVVFEHPTSEVEPSDRAAAGHVVQTIIERRGVSALALTADHDFARAFGSRVLSLDAATGRLTERRRGWFSRRLV
jgi:glycine betaine/proline transport system ATP-binding protein